MNDLEAAALLVQIFSKTLDVDRARWWLVKNHPNDECRHLAELLHDYALSVVMGDKN